MNMQKTMTTVALKQIVCRRDATELYRKTRRYPECHRLASINQHGSESGDPIGVSPGTNNSDGDDRECLFDEKEYDRLVRRGCLRWGYSSVRKLDLLLNVFGANPNIRKQADRDDALAESKEQERK